MMFFTFHPKVFHKLLLTQNYLSFFILLTQNFLSFAIYPHNFFYFQLWSFIIFIFRKFFALCLVLNFVT
ncbi:hypothetical protein HanRHA438_Chr12g0558021 [Helianthus annuus]|nr:hypothetical protein HanRHA438_Chr12g0558021 [Helianthus annuus]